MAQFDNNDSFKFSKFSEFEVKGSTLKYCFNTLLDKLDDNFKKENEILFSDMYRNIDAVNVHYTQLEKELIQEKKLTSLLINNL